MGEIRRAPEGARFTCLLCHTTFPLLGEPAEWRPAMDIHQYWCPARREYDRIHAIIGDHMAQMPPGQTFPATVEHVDTITGDQLRQGLGVFAQCLAAVTTVGSPIAGFIGNTAGTKIAGLIVGGAGAASFLLAQGFHVGMAKMGHALGLALSKR